MGLPSLGVKLPPLSKGMLMRIRGIWLALVVLLIAVPAGAHEHKMDLYGAVSVESGSALVGLHGTVNTPLRKNSRGVRDVSLVTDASVHWGSDDKRKSNVLAGVRYTFAQSVEQKHLPFVQVLLGGAEHKGGAAGDWDGAVALGIGLDSMIGGGDHPKWGIRLQGDYIRQGGTNTARVSVGFVKRWKD